MILLVLLGIAGIYQAARSGDLVLKFGSWYLTVAACVVTLLQQIA